MCLFMFPQMVLISDDRKSLPGGGFMPFRTFICYYVLMVVIRVMLDAGFMTFDWCRSVLILSLIFHTVHIAILYIFEEQFVKWFLGSKILMLCVRQASLASSSVPVGIAIIVTCPDCLNCKIPALLNF